MSLDRFEGCLLGLALGDALGARFEGRLPERLLWSLIGTTRAGEMRFTDDTQMSLDLAESLIDHRAVDPFDLARRFAASYRWSRGYGPGTARVLKRIRRGADWRDASRSVFPGGSYGNGGAMRAPVVGLFFARRPGELPAAARESAIVTHAHPLGIEGAVLVAAATASALATDDASDLLAASAAHCASAPFTTRLEVAREWLESAQSASPEEVRKRLGNGIAAAESCVTALYTAVRFLGEPFLELQTFVTRCGGDVDTIGAMAGAIWGAANGAAALPPAPLEKLEARGRLVAVARALQEAAPG